MTDTERILEAIRGLDQKTEARFAELSARITAGERKTKRQDVKIDRLERVLSDLLSSDAVLRREGRQAVLQKEKVYRRFEREGIDKRGALSALEHARRLICDGSGCRTAVYWDRDGGKAVRAIKIWL